MTTATPTADPFQLTPVTEPGQRFVALCEAHAADFATRAVRHDRAGSFPFENFEALQQSGVMAACVPEEFGGLGLESGHDYVVGMGRLGRGDGATAIAVNMHLMQVWVMARVWRAARAAGHSGAGLERRLRAVAAGKLVLCLLASEPGTGIFHPLT
jgi:alkylation response protein AidB-like acyl-CoA dehydrogenase